MRILYNGLFQQLKQAGINDRFKYGYRWSTGVESVQAEFDMIVVIRAVLLRGVPIVSKILKMGFPNKRISCKRKRRNQY